MPTLSKNIVTDYGAVGDGATSDVTPFTNFRTWARLQTDPIELTLPSGKTFVQGTIASGSFIPFVDGIKNLTVIGYGATLESSSGTYIDWKLGPQVPLSNDLAHSGRIASAFIGETSVRLLTLSDASKFTVGNWVLVSGFDLQGFGFPPNAGFFDFVQITAIDAGTGIVSIGEPLTCDYKSTWPDYGDDQMGPAKLWVLSSWDTVVTFRGLTVNDTAQCYAPCRDVTFRDCTFGGDQGFVPTLNKSARLIRTVSPICTMEVDKLVSYLEFDNSTIRRIRFQSSSVALTVMKNSSTVTSFWHGSGAKTIITDSTIADFGPGADTTGASGEIICLNTHIDTMTPKGTGSGNIPSQSDYTMTDGVIRWVNAMKTQNWPYPGGWCHFRGRFQEQGPVFQVTDVTQDATYTYAHTTLSGTFDDIPHYSSTIAIHVHPAPKCTFVNCTGAAGLALNEHTPGAPLGTNFKQSYPGGVYNDFPYIWGPMVSVIVNPTVIYGGVSSPVFYFNFPALARANGSYDQNWNPLVDPKHTGARTITPSSVTGTQSGDTLGAAPGVGNSFIPGSMLKPTYNADLTGDPVSVTVTLKTDQDVERTGSIFICRFS